MSYINGVISDSPKPGIIIGKMNSLYRDHSITIGRSGEVGGTIMHHIYRCTIHGCVPRIIHVGFYKIINWKVSVLFDAEGIIYKGTIQERETYNMGLIGADINRIAGPGIRPVPYDTVIDDYVPCIPRNIYIFCPRIPNITIGNCRGGSDMQSDTIPGGIMNICVRYDGVATVYIDPGVRRVVDVTIHYICIRRDFHSTIAVSSVTGIIDGTVIYYRCPAPDKFNAPIRGLIDHTMIDLSVSIIDINPNSGMAYIRKIDIGNSAANHYYASIIPSCLGWSIGSDRYSIIPGSFNWQSPTITHGDTASTSSKCIHQNNGSCFNSQVACYIYIIINIMWIIYSRPYSITCDLPVMPHCSGIVGNPIVEQHYAWKQHQCC